MELLIPVTVFAGLVIILLFYFVFKYQKKSNPVLADDVAAPQPAARRAVGTRNRIRDGAVQNRHGTQNVGNEPVEEGNASPQIAGIDDPKIGAKKRAKLEAKAEKKAQREAEVKIREQRKKQQEKDDAERKLRDEKERQEEEKKEEEEKRLLEEKKKKEEDEYQKMKEAFTVEEEGFDDDGEGEPGNLLQEFINHIKDQKVVMLEDLAAKFHLKIQTIVNRIDELQASGVLTGVIDDRGKFIYITLEELRTVADFVKKRGRVTIQELVENSNNLITLN